MKKSSQGFAGIFVLLLALFGLVSGIYLAQQRTRLENKAASTATISPPWGSALQLNGVNGNVVVPNNASLNFNKPFSVEMWVRLAPEANFPMTNLVSKTGQYRVSMSSEIQYSTRYTVVHLGYNNIDRDCQEMGLTYHLEPRVNFPPTEEWIQLAWNITETNMSVAVNGVTRMSSTHPPGNVCASNSDLVIGSNGFSDIIEELRISNNTRAVLVQSQPFSADSNTIAVYHFDQNLLDSSPLSNHGQQSGMITYFPIIPTPTPTPTPVINNPPEAKFSFAQYGNNPKAVKFTNLSSDPDNDPMTYYWTFGDGTSSTEASPTHIYKVLQKMYVVYLYVKDNHQGTSQIYNYVKIPITKK